MNMQIDMMVLSVILVVLLVIGGIYINGFKNWLVWAVTEAEKMFGSKTGQLKLRYAYELAATRFPIVAKLIPFNVFGSMVDNALVIMRTMIEKNQTIADIVSKKEDNK